MQDVRGNFFFPFPKNTAGISDRIFYNKSSPSDFRKPRGILRVLCYIFFKKLYADLVMRFANSLNIAVRNLIND